MAWYPWAVPGAHNGVWTSKAWMTGSQAKASARLSLVSKVGRPALWHNSQRTGMPSFPAWPNSGQYVATGASTSSKPRWASRLAHAAVAPLVAEKTSWRVSSPYAAPRATPAVPPQTSTTLRPPTWRQNAAPTAPCRSKLAWNASATPLKPGSTNPPTAVLSAVPLSRSVGPAAYQDHLRRHPGTPTPSVTGGAEDPARRDEMNTETMWGP